VIFDNVSKNCVYLQNIHFLSRLHIDIWTNSSRYMFAVCKNHRKNIVLFLF
jgi:hypothetical protein